MDNGYSEDVNGQRVVHEAVSWPFEWYLRDYKNRRYYSKTIPQDINLRDYPVILVMAPNLDPIKDQLGDYVGQKYRLNWWFPEDYKAWASNPSQIVTSLLDPVQRSKFFKFLLYREPMNILGATIPGVNSLLHRARTTLDHLRSKGRPVPASSRLDVQLHRLIHSQAVSRSASKP